MSEAVELVNRLNGVKDIYRSVYNYDNEIAPENTMIDKVFLDFDPEDDDRDIIKDIRKVQLELDKRDLVYSIFFSGRGYHIYVYTEPIIAEELNSPADAIRNFVYDLIQSAEGSGGPIKYDTKVVGDLMRVSRLPGTLNIKTNRYCIPLTESEVRAKSTVDISQIAQKQRKKITKNGTKLLDLSKYDSTVKKHNLRGVNFGFDDDDIEFDVNVERLPLCVQELLKCGDPGYNERYLIIVAMRDLAYPLGSTMATLEKYLSREKFNHCVYEEQQPQYLYSRPDLIFPTCHTIKQRGSCISGCSGQNIYY
jgi:hypothetical protein